MSCFISADVVFSQLNDLFSWPNYCCFCTRFNWLSPVHTSVPFHKCEFQDAKRKLIADKKALLAKAKTNSFWFSFFICHYCWKCDKCDKYQQRNVNCVYVWPCRNLWSNRPTRILIITRLNRFIRMITTRVIFSCWMYSVKRSVGRSIGPSHLVFLFTNCSAFRNGRLKGAIEWHCASNGKWLHFFFWFLRDEKKIVCFYWSQIIIRIIDLERNSKHKNTKKENLCGAMLRHIIFAKFHCIVFINYYLIFFSLIWFHYLKWIVLCILHIVATENNYRLTFRKK